MVLKLFVGTRRLECGISRSISISGLWGSVVGEEVGENRRGLRSIRITVGGGATTTEDVGEPRRGRVRRGAES